jgi:hypothetical protein
MVPKLEMLWRGHNQAMLLLLLLLLLLLAK